ncbi:hypothetical protein [Aquimarina sp. SS2-1]|uniref:hypothetical protein n=1 Tax=Aquimarina besae TaxID=3342247 RepID=UPI00366AE29B
MKTLLFIGHPGHELLAHKFLSVYKPDVVFLTMGSGSNDSPRIQQSIDLIESLGLNVYYPFEPFTDRQIYDLILSHSVDSFHSVKSALKEFIVSHNIEMIVGDALEGFNPSHDVCRYLINATVFDLKDKVLLKNYDFFQEDVRMNRSASKKPEDITLELDETELQNKMAASLNYPEIKLEVDKFVEHYGVEFFNIEYFRKVNDPLKIKNWNTEFPFYEEFGRKRIKEGTYSELISFKEHMEPLAKKIFQLG